MSDRAYICDGEFHLKALVPGRLVSQHSYISYFEITGWGQAGSWTPISVSWPCVTALSYYSVELQGV